MYMCQLASCISKQHLFTLIVKSMFEQPVRGTSDNVEVCWSTPAIFVEQITKVNTACFENMAPRVTFSLDSKGYMQLRVPLIVHTTSEVLREVQRSLKWL